MNAATLVVLARPTTRVEVIRTAIIAGCVAVALALVLVALAIVAVAPTSWRDSSSISMGSGLSTYLLESGLQPGVIAVVLVATLPVLALALQAIRLGATDRTRRSGALAVAGATPHQLRLVSAARSALPLGWGGLLAGPVYVVLWLLLGRALPPGSRFVPDPTWRLAVAWLAGAVVVGLAGAALGALDATPDDPTAPGARRPMAIAGRAAIAVLGCAALTGGLLAMNGAARYSDDVVLPAVGGLVAAALLAVGGAGFAADARRRGRRLHRRGDGVAVLASARVNADSAVLGRTGGTLFVSGVVLAIGIGLAVALATGPDRVDTRFFGTGIGALVLAVALAALLAFASLVMSALDHVLSARRALATLAVHGGDENLVVAAISAQFAVVAIPALTSGTAVGGLLATAAFGNWGGGVVAAVGVGAVILCALTRWAAPGLCQVAARTVSPAVRTAMRAEHLRAA